MKNHFLTLLATAIVSSSCLSHNSTNNTNLSLSDKKATAETKALYQKLNNLSQKGFLFGHQDDLAYGVKWKYEDGRSKKKDCYLRFSLVSCFSHLSS